MIKYNRTLVGSVGNSNSGLDKYSINSGSSEANLITQVLNPNAPHITLPHASPKRPSFIN